MTMATKFVCRQGDVMVRQRAVPEGATRVDVRPLALGEKTGHHHSLAVAEPLTLADCVEMYEKDGEVFVRIYTEGVVVLTHQEHKSHAIPAGDYQVVIQQENTDWGSRAVLD
jgi:hypothetical protein